MRPAVPPSLAHLSPRELGQWMLRTGTWLSGSAGATRGSLRQAGAGWEPAEPVTPERWYRDVVASPPRRAVAAAERHAEASGPDLEAG